MKKMIIGVDPDSDKHGVAIYIDSKLVALYMWQLMDFYEFVKKAVSDGYLVHVHIENVCGNNAAFTKKGAGSQGSIRNVSRSLGKCQQSQVEIERVCDRIGVSVFRHKISSAWKKTAQKRQFELATGWKGNSNEDKRSAAWFGYLGCNK